MLAEAFCISEMMNVKPYHKVETIAENSEGTRIYRKCLYHPALRCPAPNQPCVFTESGKIGEACQKPHQLKMN